MGNDNSSPRDDTPVEGRKNEPQEPSNPTLDAHAPLTPNIQNAPLNPIKGILNEQLSSTALDSLRDSQFAAHELAKSMIQNTLKAKKTKGQFGELLNYMFSYESVLYPTRWLVYWSLNSNDTVLNTTYQAKWQVDYWGKNSGKDEVIAASKLWLASSENRKECINPLMFWALNQKEVKDPIAAVVIDALPYIKKDVVDAMKWCVSESLKSEDIKQSVKDGLLFYLKNVSSNGNNNSADDKEKEKEQKK